MTVRKLCIAASAIALLAGAAGIARAQGFQLEEAFPNLTFEWAVDIQQPNSIHTGGQLLFVVEKRGVIYNFPELIDVSPADRTVFLDISDKVDNYGEAGLVGLAFHPQYPANGYFFVFYVGKPPHGVVVARYQVSSDPRVADPNSELVLIDDSKNTSFHNGGQLAFGPGRLLYISIGDDQSYSNGQDLNDIKGAVLRIAPNIAGDDPPYTIPPTNPFAGNQDGYREEIFAYGFRNPWRFSIDAVTGRMWLGDVGEDHYEEINVIESGGNYGWPLMEGPDCFLPSSCDTLGKDLRAPIALYDHSVGNAVISGYVYRGTRLPELTGQYIFGDFSGGLWTIYDDGVNPPIVSDLVVSTPNILAIGVGNPPKSDVYFSLIDGTIRRLARVLPTGVDTPVASDRLLGNFPNPFNPSTTIRYRLESAGQVQIDIVSVDGARVRRLEGGRREAGDHALEWHGETDGGTRSASGVYFYRLIVDGRVADSARMVLVQ